MAEYIDREALIKEIDESIEHDTKMLTREQNYYVEKGLRIARKDIMCFPAADVVEVKHGYWKDLEYGTCSICNRSIREICDADSSLDYGVLEHEIKVCPFCGAKIEMNKMSETE